MRKFLVIAVLLVLAACRTVPDADGFNALQIAVLQENGFVAQGDDWALGLPDRLLFASSESSLVTMQSERLDAMARALVAVDIRGARVEGHTDSTGSRVFNQQLSESRAEAVRSVLIAGGMKPDAVKAIGRGESDPVVSNRTAAGRQENRRVVIVVSSAAVF